jgi:hypothetical protein
MKRSASQKRDILAGFLYRKIIRFGFRIFMTGFRETVIKTAPLRPVDINYLKMRKT